MKRLRIVLAVFAIGMAALALVVWLIPLGTYIPRIESAASKALGQPVRIEGLRASLLPWPSATLSGVRVGKRDELEIDRLAVVPELLSLLRPTVVVRRVEISGLRSETGFLASLMPTEKPAGPPPAAVREVRLNTVALAVGETKLPSLGGQIELAEDGSLATAHIATEDRALELTVTPSGEALRLKLSGKAWTMTVGPALRFDTLEAEGTLRGARLSLPSASAKLYGGSAKAAVDVSWETGAKLAGKASASGLDLESLAALFAKARKFEGRLDAEATFSAQARTWAAVADVVRADGRFSVRDGVLHNMDLARAAQLIGGKESRGGQTRFDTLSGNYHVRGKAVRLDALKVSSGTLNADGEIEISPTRQLGGKVGVAAKAGGSQVRVPLKLSGTLESPVLLPSGAAVAGAAVGTVVLGPGAGTSAGIGVGEAIDKLFAGKK